MTDSTSQPARCTWCCGTGRFADHDCRFCAGQGNGSVFASAAQPAEREQRLMDAIEGECDGLAISRETAREVMRYVDTGLPPDEPAETKSPLTGKYGEVLGPFMALMEAELHANAAKGDRPGWLAMTPSTALLEIYWHTAKLSAAVKNNDAALIREHSADVANMAMMLLDVCVGITATQPAA